MSLHYAQDDEVVFKRTIQGTLRELTGVIETVDHADITLPYYIETEGGNGGYWVAESDVVRKISSVQNAQLDRIEAKLDAIIRHFNVPFE